MVSFADIKELLKQCSLRNFGLHRRLRYFVSGHGFLITLPVDFSRPANLARPASLQPSLELKPWSTLRPSEFTEGLLGQPGPLMPTGSPLTAQPSPPPVKAPPPHPLPLNPLSVDRGLDQQEEDRSYASSVWITRLSLPWFPVAITSSV